MSAATVEVLYYNLNNAVLLGDSEKSRMYLDLLRQEYNDKEESFIELQKDNRFTHLKQLGDIVDKGLVVKNFNLIGSENAQLTEKDESQVDKEHQLVKIIGQNVSSLRDILNASNDFHLENLEQPTLFGRIDITAQDKMTAYVIELKKSEGRYSVISQINKYVLDYKLRLILKFWTDVIGVVIANSFLDQVVREIVILGIIPIKYSYDNGILKLRRLDG